MDNKQIFDLITQKYQPSQNEKANRANNPPVQGVSALPPRIVRSQSANDAPGVGGAYDYHAYGDQYASQDPRYYHGAQGAQTYTDPYVKSHFLSLHLIQFKIMINNRDQDMMLMVIINIKHNEPLMMLKQLIINIMQNKLECMLNNKDHIHI